MPADSIGRTFLVGGAAALSGVFWVYHVWLARWMKALGEPLGALGPRKAVPLYSGFDFHFGVWALPALAIVGAFVFFGPSLYARRGSSVGTVSASLACFWAICLSVSMIDGYKQPVERSFFPDPVPSFLEPFSQKGHEYYWDVRVVNRIGGPLNYLREFATPRVQGRFSLHGGTHPPGGGLFLWAVSQVFGYSLWSTSLAAIAASGLALVFAFALAWELFGAAVARISTALLVVTPSLVLFTATSMDGPFSVLIIASAWLFARAAVRSDASVPFFGVALGLTLAASAAMTYATFCLGFFFLTVLALGARTAWFPLKRLVAILTVAFFVFVAAVALVSWWTGYEPIAAYRAARDHDAEMMGTGYETLGRYLGISTGNLAAFLIGLGMPTVVLWGRALARRTPSAVLPQPGWLFAAAGAITVLIMGVSTLFTFEVERIWLFALPFATIPVAALIDGAANRTEAFRWTLGLLALQTISMEVFLNTRW